MTSEIELALAKNHTLSESSRRIYTANYKRLLRLTDKEPILNISEERLLRIIDIDINSPPQSKNSLISVAMIIRKENGLESKKLSRYRGGILLKKKEADKKIKNEKLLHDDIGTIKDLQKYTKLLYTNKDYVGYIVNTLLLKFGVRNKDINCIITLDKRVTYKDNPAKVNYLYVTQKYILFIRNDYKTFSTYGKKINKLEILPFTRAVNFVLGDNFETPLLSLNNDEPVSENSVSKIVQRHTFREFGEGKYFKIQILDLKKQGNIDRIIELSRSRGTDLMTVFDEYDLERT